MPQSDTAALAENTKNEQLRRITQEDTIRLQIYEITRRRTKGEPIVDAVEALADAAFVYWDEMFEQEWENRVCAAVFVQDDRGDWDTVFVPTDEDAKEWFRIIMRMLKRRDALAYSRTTSRTPAKVMPYADPTAE